jgi:hypothetical protein
MATNLSEELAAYLTKWHATTVKKKLHAGCEVNLSLDEFVSLLEKRQLNSLQKAMDEERLEGQQNSRSPFAYVATWKSYAARSTNIYNAQTAVICSRMKSERINRPMPGDVLRPAHREKISHGLTGRELTPEHRQNISHGCKGVPKAAWTEQRKADRRAQLAAKKEKKNA